ncbi:MAG: hypothetical protein K2X03_30110 [Bryobacteraceae bacterium]|nr:hypothetical protein [Bryobacteraceae bacterium]
MKFALLLLVCLFSEPGAAWPQALSVPWSGYAHDAQHTAISSVASQPLNRIRWQTAMDLNPQFSGSSLLIHYGSPLVTAANTVLVPVKTGATDGFRVEARRGADGALLYTLTTDYSLPAHGWTPSYGPVVSARNRLYYAGAGGTVYYRDSPDAVSGASGQIAFYGNAAYASNPTAFNNSVKISTPITSDRLGNIFFGYEVSGPNPLNLVSGLAKISFSGVGTFVSAATAAADNSIAGVSMNCAPALSNDHRLLYYAVSTGYTGAGYLVSVDSRNLQPVARIRLKDPSTLADALLYGDGTSSPTVGPDGDVYFGVLENPFLSHNARGWLLHFDGGLTQTKIPGAFGWDDTASIVPAKLVASYQGPSPYLLLTKYNNYFGVGTGDGNNRVAIIDPFVSAVDPISGKQTMREVIAIAGPTPEDDHPGVREWCINTAAIDPFTQSALINSEDGKLYRWDFSTNTFTQQIVLTPGIGEAYTPTLIGVDGTVYAINNATLFAVGN